MEMDWDRSVSGEIREESWSAVREVEISRADQGYLSWGGVFSQGSIYEGGCGTRKWNRDRIRTYQH